jgi:hypothetical protein
MQKTGSKKNKVILQTPGITKNLDKQLSPDSLYIIFVIILQRLNKLIYLYSNITTTATTIFFFTFSSVTC